MEHRVKVLIGNRADRVFLPRRRAIACRPDTVLIAMATSAGTISSDASQVKHRLMMLTALLMVRLDQSSLIMSSRTSLSFFGPNSVTVSSRKRWSKGRRAARIVMCSPVGTPSRE